MHNRLSSLVGKADALSRSLRGVLHANLSLTPRQRLRKAKALLDRGQKLVPLLEEEGLGDEATDLLELVEKIRERVERFARSVSRQAVQT